MVGNAVGWLSERIVPRTTLTWAQVRRGPAEGIWLQLNPRTGLAMLEGRGEPRVQAALVEHLQLGMTFCDVGANIGFFSMLAARLVGPAGCVVSFEADPEIAQRLRANVAKNSFSWIRVEQQAVCAEPSKVFFHRADATRSPDRGEGHIVADRSANAISVTATSLDAYAWTKAGPDLVKCDVEGAEVEVFRGAEHLLCDKRPKILCEMHSEANRRTLQARLAGLEYECLMLDVNHLLALPR
jgi:FkbM family methyltransferase